MYYKNINANFNYQLEKKVQSNTNKIASHTHSEENSEEEYEEESCPPKPDTMAPFNATRVSFLISCNQKSRKIDIIFTKY